MKGHSQFIPLGWGKPLYIMLSITQEVKWNHSLRVGSFRVAFAGGWTRSASGYTGSHSALGVPNQISSAAQGMGITKALAIFSH